MTKNIDKVKDLMENGYKISDIEIEYKEGSGKVIVSLVKNSKKIFIRDSSQEFLRFISCFKKIRNKYNNFHFEFLDKSMALNSAPSLEEPCPIKGDYLVKLSGRYFDKGLNISSCNVPQTGRKNTSYKKMLIFQINLETNPEFLECDFKDEIELFKRPNDEIVFRGLIKESIISNNILRLITQDYSSKLDNITIQGAETHGLGLHDMLLLLISPAEKLRIGNIPGTPNLSIREFIVIVPIKNLILNETIQIGCIELYQDFSTVDDYNIRASGIGRITPEWNGNYPRAKSIVKSQSFLSALREGYSKISNAIDLIALRNDLSFPKLKINKQNYFINFDSYRLYAQVKIPSWVYCREKYTDSYLIMNLEFIKENILALENKPQEYFDIINKLFSKLLDKEILTIDEKNILQVLHWLRRAIQSSDNKDKLLDLWTAMEFLVSGIKVNHLFNNKDILEFKKLIETNELFTVDQKNAIYGKIEGINDAPLMAKIDNLEKELGINFSLEEKILLRSTRRKRNDIIHGKKDAEIFESEVDKLKSVIEKLLLEKIGSQEN